jgi:hypothetical protein
MHTSHRLRTAVRVSGLLVAAVLCVATVSGCANWWLPQITAEQIAEAADAEDTELGQVQTIGITADSLPAAWNAAAAASGSEFLLPDPLAADDETAGISEVTVASDDGAFSADLKWDSDGGVVTSGELTGTATGDPAESDARPVLESFFAATLGLDPTAAAAYVDGLITAGLDASGDPTMIDYYDETNPAATIYISLADGAVYAIVTPSAGSATTEESPSAEASASS